MGMWAGGQVARFGFLPVCVRACPPVGFSACLLFSAGLPLCLSACLLVCLPVCLPACLPVCLPACLLVFLPACLPWWQAGRRAGRQASGQVGRRAGRRAGRWGGGQVAHLWWPGLLVCLRERERGREGERKGGRAEERGRGREGEATGDDRMTRTSTLKPFWPEGLRRWVPSSGASASSQHGKPMQRSFGEAGCPACAQVLRVSLRRDIQ